MASHFYKYAQNDRPISIYLEMFLSLFFFNSVQTDCAYSVAFEKRSIFLSQAVVLQGENVYMFSISVALGTCFVNKK